MSSISTYSFSSGTTTIENFTDINITITSAFEEDSEASDGDELFSSSDADDMGYNDSELVVIDRDGKPIFTPSNSNDAFTMLSPRKVSFYPVPHQDTLIKVTIKKARYESLLGFLFVPKEDRVLKIYEQNIRKQITLYVGQTQKKFELIANELSTIIANNEMRRNARLTIEGSLYVAILKKQTTQIKTHHDALYHLFDKACWHKKKESLQAILYDDVTFHCYPSAPKESFAARDALYLLLRFKPLSALLSLPKKSMRIFGNRHGCALLDLNGFEGQVIFVSAAKEISKRTILDKPKLPPLCTEFSRLKTVGYWQTEFRLKVLLPVESCPVVPHHFEQVYTDEKTAYQFVDGEFAEELPHEKIMQIVMEPLKLFIAKKRLTNLHFTFT